MSANPQRAVTVANCETMVEMIRLAKRRIILMAPGVSHKVAKALVEGWQALPPDAVTVILDVSADVFRFGYGDLSALQLLEKTAADMGRMIDRQSGIRIGLLIVDDETLVYSPTPRLIEAGPKQPETPNAIRLGIPPADVERDLGAGPEGLKERSLGLDKAERHAIERVDKELKLCPPQEFDVSRRVMVFNAFFEFVELRISGVSIQRKIVKIPSDLLLALDSETQSKINATYKLIESDDALSGKALEDDRKLLAQRFLRHIAGHGAALQRSRKEEFLKEFKKLEEALAKHRKNVKTSLEARLRERQEYLHEHLLPFVTTNVPSRWRNSAFYEEKNPAYLAEMLRVDLSHAFGTADQLLGEMAIQVVFKAVTYESLKDKKFMELARKAFPELGQLYEEEAAAKGRSVAAAK